MSHPLLARCRNSETPPSWFGALSTKLKHAVQMQLLRDAGQRELLRLKGLDYSSVKLAPFSEEAIQTVQGNAQTIHQGEQHGWNFYSNALRREVVETFERAVLDVAERFGTVDFLEIGSAQGLSMSVIGLLLRARGALGQLTSIDPYFDMGYFEGSKGIWEKGIHVGITKRTRQLALSLYQSVGLEVELLEMISLDGLRALHQAGRRFHLIYIDGSHEGLNPLLDFGLSCGLLHSNSVMMLDDHHWPDIQAVKLLCDKHCARLHECWKVAAYRIASNGLGRLDSISGEDCELERSRPKATSTNA